MRGSNDYLCRVRQAGKLKQFKIVRLGLLLTLGSGDHVERAISGTENSL